MVGILKKSKKFFKSHSEIEIHELKFHKNEDFFDVGLDIDIGENTVGFGLKTAKDQASAQVKIGEDVTDFKLKANA